VPLFWGKEMKNRLMVFGGGVNQLSLIKTAKQKELFTVVIDPNPDAPAKGLSDVFEVIGPKDLINTIRIAEKYKIEGIVTCQMENPLFIMAQVAEKMGFIFPTYEQIMNARNKYHMKQCFLRFGVPCAIGFLLRKEDLSDKDTQRRLFYPAIIKPVDSFSSRGVYKVGGLDEVEKYVDETVRFSSTGEFIFEEYMAGPEVSVESITYNGETNIIQITDKTITEYPNTVEIGHVQPSGLEQMKQNEIGLLVKNAINALGLDNCAAHTEVIMTEEGPKVVELGARLGGDFITSHLVPLSCGVDIEAAAIDIALGFRPIISRTLNAGTAIRYLQLPSGKVSFIKEWGEIFKDEGVILADINIKQGDEIPEITDSAKRPGFVIVKGRDGKDAIEKSLRAASKLAEFVVVSN
jgi:biotin carboxylase